MKKKEKALVYSLIGILASTIVVLAVVGFSAQEMNKINDRALGFRVEELFEKSRHDIYRSDVYHYQFKYPETGWSVDNKLHTEENNSLSDGITDAVAYEEEKGYDRSFKVHIAQTIKEIDDIRGDNEEELAKEAMKKIVKEQFPGNKNIQVTETSINGTFGVQADDGKQKIVLLSHQSYVMIKMKSDDLAIDGVLNDIFNSFKFTLIDQD